MARRVPWEAGHLWQRLQAQSAHGLTVGALQSIKTNTTHIEDRGIRFLVYVLANLSRKEKARKQQGKSAPANPFLPYEDDLYVCDVSPTHVCLLNKFNVVDHHFLIVTRDFEPQESWLTQADFEALVRCLAEVDGLAFFNGGQIAGASQPHKHLQVVPRTATGTDFPMESAVVAALKDRNGEKLPFECAIASIPTKNISNKNIAQTPDSALYLRTYQKLLHTVGIPAGPAGYTGQQTAAYNLLCTREWMMVVPRTQEKHANISVNSLGFAGTLLVKNQEQLAQLEGIGPMQLLQTVSR